MPEETKIHKISLGVDNCYLIKNEKIILIDGGSPKKSHLFRKYIKKIGIKESEIHLIILTHGHWDHIGSVKKLVDLTGAKLAIHKNERHIVEGGLKIMPPGVTTWGKIFGKILESILPFIKINSTKVDIEIDDKGFSLEEYGIEGKVIYTPGHSSGSVSIILATGEAFVGDMAMNGMPLRIGPGLPIFAEDLKKLKDSWKILIEQGIKTIYPAHGKPFSVEVMKSEISKI